METRTILDIYGSSSTPVKKKFIVDVEPADFAFMGVKFIYFFIYFLKKLFFWKMLKNLEKSEKIRENPQVGDNPSAVLNISQHNFQ